MKISHMVVFGFGMLVMGAVGFTAGCGDSAVFCSFKVATISECFSETPAGDVTSDDISKACTAEGGKTGSSCPTAGLRRRLQDHVERRDLGHVLLRRHGLGRRDRLQGHQGHLDGEVVRVEHDDARGRVARARVIACRAMALVAFVRRVRPDHRGEPFWVSTPAEVTTAGRMKIEPRVALSKLAKVLGVAGLMVTAAALVGCGDNPCQDVNDAIDAARMKPMCSDFIPASSDDGLDPSNCAVSGQPGQDHPIKRSLATRPR